MATDDDYEYDDDETGTSGAEFDDPDKLDDLDDEDFEEGDEDED
jgi:hypothetical protein